MRFKVAVVEDDDLIREMIAVHLKKNGHEVQGFSSAERFAQAYRGKTQFDLLILDILLPNTSGDDLLKQIRKKGDRTPTIMLTAKGDISTRLQAFHRGADDFLLKPFDLDELQARVESVIRRSQGKRLPPASDVFDINRFRIDGATRYCSSNLGKIRLSEKEMALLRFLVENPHETLSRADILEEVWGMDVAPTPRTVDNFILKFRKLFEVSPGQPRHFLSIRGRGYRFID